MFNSLRYRILFWLLVFISITAGLIIYIYEHVEGRKEQMALCMDNVSHLHIDMLKLFKVTDNFLYAGVSNPHFFATGESEYFTSVEGLSGDISSRIEILAESTDSWQGYMSKIEAIGQDFEQYLVLFDSLVLCIYKQGYKETGLEGELADYGHRLEKQLPGDPLMLSLRRYEQDYLLRGTESSLKHFSELFSLIEIRVQQSKPYDLKNRQEMAELLGDYAKTFYALTNLKRQIGLFGSTGLRASLSQVSITLDRRLNDLNHQAFRVQQKLIAGLRGYYVLSLTLLLMAAMAISFILSRRITAHLEALSQYISRLTSENFRIAGRLELKKTTTEIRNIYREFRNMVARLHIRERERDEALLAARDNEYRYRNLTDMLPQSIFETDELGNFTYVNQSWYNTFGYSHVDLSAGLNLIETVISGTNDNILGQLKLENSDFVAIRKDGTRFPAAMYSDTILRHGAIAGRIGLILDVTERNLFINNLKKETHKARTSDQLKSSFLANMSHEIRTPMNSIIGFSSLLGSDGIPEEHKKNYLSYIRSSGEMLLNLIDDIIDIAKIEAGEIKINKKECAVYELLQELYTTFSSLKTKAGKEHLELKLHNVIPGLAIKTDPFRLRQVLTNLLSNALKFTDQGFVEIGCRMKSEKLLEFFVKDSGVGLSRDEISIVFERFKRTSHSEENNIMGTGLGLSISKNLVELMGGDMWVDSLTGSGTTFSFTLPLIRATSMNAEEMCLLPLEMYQWEKNKVLVVEDDTQSYFFLSELLKHTGIQVTRAVNGREAVELCRLHNDFDLVLMDIQMPELNGYEATRQIKQIHPMLTVLAQTAFAMAGDKEKSLASGCDDHIAKPINIEHLLPKIQRILDSKKQDNVRLSREKGQELIGFIRNKP